MPVRTSPQTWPDRMDDITPIDALCGRSMGGLGGQKLRFRPQLFWQEVLHEHQVNTEGLELKFDLASGRNFARIRRDGRGDDEVSAHGSYEAVAKRLWEGPLDSSEARLVARALREAAQFVDSKGAEPLRHLICSTHCTLHAVEAALFEASKHGNVAGVQCLLGAGARPSAVSDERIGKSALHIAVEEAQEEVAKLLVRAEPGSIHVTSAILGGKTPLDIARDNDMGLLARRLTEYARECSTPGAATATPGREANDDGGPAQPAMHDSANASGPHGSTFRPTNTTTCSPPRLRIPGPSSLRGCARTCRSPCTPRSRSTFARARFAMIRTSSTTSVEGPERVAYAVFDGGGPSVVVESFPIASREINRLMPRLLDELNATVSLTERLSAVHFLGTQSGDMLVSLIYQGSPMPAGWRAAAEAAARASSCHPSWGAARGTSRSSGATG